VPLHQLVRDALVAYGLPRSGPVFIRARKAGGPLKPNTISRYVSQYLHSLGIASSAHRGRSAYATAMYPLSGRDLLLVAELLGHSNLSHCRRYVAWAPTRAASVAARLVFPGLASAP
jgi:site-specific recombinase XerD